MTEDQIHRLYILTGPSCVGKTPLMHALRSRHTDLMGQIQRVVLYNSRAKRLIEHEGVDYYFRSRKEMEEMVHDAGKIVLEVRGDLQALDIEALGKGLKTHHFLFEGNPFIAEVLSQVKRLESIPHRSVFISPLSREEIGEILQLKNPEEVVADIMRTKLLKRTQKQKGNLALPDLETIERRARSAWSEIKMAPMFDAVIANHDGEDSENWNAYPVLIGEARRTLDAVYQFFREGTSSAAEKWTNELFQPRSSDGA